MVFNVANEIFIKRNGFECGLYDDNNNELLLFIYSVI